MKFDEYAYDFQILAARALKSMGGRGLLALEQGLGKSATWLLFLERNPHLRPAIVVCPASLKYNWEDEARRHFGMRAQVLEGTKPKQGRPMAPAPLYIVSYNLLGRRGGKHSGPGWGGWLTSLKPNAIALDECQAISSRTSLQTRWVRALCHGVESVVPMSGTPLTNRPNELFTVLNLIRPDLFPRFRDYADEYCDPKPSPWGMDYSGAKNLDRLHKILTRECMIRKRKADVLKELPEKTRSVVPVPLKDAREYLHAHRDFLGWLAKHSPERVFRASRAARLVRVGYLMRIVGKQKLPSVYEWVDNYLNSSDRKLVLFAYHTEVLDSLEKRYRHLCVRIDGSTSLEDRHVRKQAFQNNSRVRLCLGNILAAGKGLTLTAADTVAFAELYWTPGGHVQAEDRVHRIGQHNPSRAVYIVARATYEERLMNILQRKQGVLSQVLDGGPTDDDLNVFDELCREIALEGRAL